MIQLLPSILSADFSRLGEELQTIEDAGVEMVHIDVMDGKICTKHFFRTACNCINQKKKQTLF